MQQNQQQNVASFQKKKEEKENKLAKQIQDKLTLLSRENIPIDAVIPKTDREYVLIKNLRIAGFTNEAIAKVMVILREHNINIDELLELIIGDKVKINLRD